MKGLIKMTKIRNERREIEVLFTKVENEKQWLEAELQSKKLIVDLYRDKHGELERGKTDSEVSNRQVKTQRNHLHKESLYLKKMLKIQHKSSLNKQFGHSSQSPSNSYSSPRQSLTRKKSPK